MDCLISPFPRRRPVIRVRLGMEREVIGGGRMYGTVMIGKLKGSAEEAMRASNAWNTERQVPGYRRSDMLFADDGQTIVVAVQFDSKEQYLALADSPEQDEWWRTVMAPMLDGEPTWIDGTWQTIQR